MNTVQKNIWCFGDSWPAGIELEELQSTLPLPNFPTVIKEKTGLNVINRGICGASQSRMLYELLDSPTQPNDIAIFALTAKTRRMYRTKDNEIHEQQFNTDEMIVNHHEDHRYSSATISLLYYMCCQRLIKPYFFNLFDTHWLPDQMFKEVPESCWLIPPSESILSTLFDPVFFHRYDNHHNGDFLEWLETENNQVKKYIRPCRAHPNIHGHKVIADYIINKLDLHSA
jgi:hypothetical protein